MSSTQTYQFKAEVSKLLDIISRSLYTNREIFLRELISNASDALDKLRFRKNKGEQPTVEQDLEVRISFDKDKKTITVADTGIGMTRDEMAEDLGTIARSGSEVFLQKLAEEADGAKDASAVIGRFGVGFYSVFMVADKVEVVSKSAYTDEPAHVWISDGAGSFELGPAESDVQPGTTVTLHIKDDAEDYLDKSKLEHTIKKHSGFISFPIILEEERINTIAAIWREPKFSISQEQYNEFYKFLTYDSEDPLETIHLSVDAPVQFNGLMFIPKRSFDLFGFDRQNYGLDLYVKRVLIQKQNNELIPEYLGFLKGVADTEDLPLNISRESLQENLVVGKMARTITKQVLNHLDKVAKERPEDYETFWNAHGKVFKLGYSDFANHEKIAPLLRFNSSHHNDADGLTSFDNYIARAKAGQKHIYFISGQSRESVKLNPHIEIFNRKGLEVLYLYEPLDEFLMDSLRKYKDYEFKSVEHTDAASLDEFPDVDKKKPETPELDKDQEKTLDDLIGRMKEILGDKVTDIRISKRLTDSPSCLVGPDGDVTSHMQKIMRIAGKDTSIPKKVMELNKDHHLVRNLLKIYEADPKDDYIATTTEQLYESSLLLEGYLADPHKMVSRINKLLEQAGKWYVDVKNI